MPNTKNFGYGTVLTAPSPATSGTSLVLNSAQGALFPPVPFPITIWPVGVRPTSANAEIVTVTAISTDTFTITRAQEGSTARSVIVGDQVAATQTANLSTLSNVFTSTSPTTQNVVLTGSTNFLAPQQLEIGSGYSVEIPSGSSLEIPGPPLRAGVVAPSYLGTGAKYALVATSETTTSASYTDLATSGPAATVTIGINGLAFVQISADLSNNTANDYSALAFAISGATVRAAGTPYETFYQSYAIGGEHKLSYGVLVTGLTPGSTTFTLKYKVITGGTSTYLQREISVIPL